MTTVTSESPDLHRRLLGVEANSRLTGMLGAVLLVALAVEGVSVLDVRGFLTWHVAVGLFVIPAICVKLGTTSFRAFQYYRGAEAYRHKGPPHPILRIAGPFVALSTVSMFAFGIVTLAAGPRHREPWLTLHQGSFAVWFLATTVHVLGHVIETWQLVRDEATNRPAIARRSVRVSVVLLSLVVGLVIGLLSLKWTGQWDHFKGHLGDG
jgi:hypothetical protein